MILAALMSGSITNKALPKSLDRAFYLQAYFPNTFKATGNRFNS